ncbi:MAG: GNAT family N-acetyltransferase [Lentisphaerota bacterium]
MFNPEITYRNAVFQDIDSVIQIDLFAFPNLICEDKKVVIERIILFPEGFRIMEIDNKFAGYICSEIWDKVVSIDKNIFDLSHSIGKQHKPNGKELYISSMGISPEHKGKGVGKGLFEEFLRYIADEFQYIESIILLVSENWKNARKIYSANGFKEINVMEKFFSYKKNEPYFENGIVMRKELLQNF